MIVRVPTIVVKLEGGVGRRTVPLLITEMTFEGEVRDWSGKVSYGGNLSTCTNHHIKIFYQIASIKIFALSFECIVQVLSFEVK